MKLFKNTLLVGSFFLAFSCSSLKQSCCSVNSAKVCTSAQCKADQSCCKKGCTDCKGADGACADGKCKVN